MQNKGAREATNGWMGMHPGCRLEYQWPATAVKPGIIASENSSAAYQIEILEQMDIYRTASSLLSNY